MITVAVAGGTSPALGRSILEGLMQYPEHLKPIVLSRTTSITPAWLKDLGIEVRKVDYTSERSLVDALKGVNTVICTLLPRDGTWDSTQITLLNAGIKAGVSRFAPAEFGPGPLSSQKVSMFKPKLTVIQALRRFMNYLGYGAPAEEDALHGFEDNWKDIWWHVKEMKAEIPLTREGHVPRVTMTEIRDVGRFVAAACLLPEGSWQEEFGMAGDLIRMDDVVRVAETVRGRKMDVVFRPISQVVKDKEMESDYYRRFWYELEEMIAMDSVGEGIVEPLLNKLCPEVMPLSVEAYIRRYWSEDGR